ncbi:hypothetical protein GGR58DRAFT_454324 [Xylaria digitata]|nr:hypothetical protein GGR58DRAFT_454324 [Xylaria digitata]
MLVFSGLLPPHYSRVAIFGPYAVLSVLYLHYGFLADLGYLYTQISHSTYLYPTRVRHSSLPQKPKLDSNLQAPLLISHMPPTKTWAPIPFQSIIVPPSPITRCAQTIICASRLLAALFEHDVLLLVRPSGGQLVETLFVFLTLIASCLCNFTLCRPRESPPLVIQSAITYLLYGYILHYLGTLLCKQDS